jgi:signal transduction histidine kinase
MKCPDYPNKLQDLNVLIRSSLKNCGIFKKTEHISLQKKLTPNLPRVRVNVDDISFVIGNLLTNALDSMPNGGKLLIESKYCKEHDSCVQISVSDTGYGIKKNKKDKIFWPFFTTKGEGKGIGLGLAISKRIIEDYGGKINVASTQGRGTTITLCLPAAFKSAKPRVAENMH